VLTEFPERFRDTRRLFLGVPPRPYAVRRARVQGGILLLLLEGVETPQAAEALRGQEVLVAAEDAVPLPPGRFYWHQVLGLEVREEGGRLLGAVADIIETGANDVYVVRDEGRELLIPAIRDVVLAIEPEAGRMTVRLLPGLEETGRST
jgi:16S rRNA processing protein RimM